MRVLHQALAVLIAGVLSVWMTACGPGGSQAQTVVAFDINLPGPIIPKAIQNSLYALQETLVTIETEGQIWVEIRGTGKIIASVLFDEQAGVVELIDLEPGRNYTVGVFAGIFTDDQDGAVGGKIRFASEQVVNIPPDETVTISADLTLCDQLEALSELKQEICDPTFGIEIAPPDPPELFPTSSRTGCSSSDSNSTLVVAGNKPENTTLKDQNGVTLVKDLGAHWVWNPFAVFAGTNFLSRNLHTAHDFDSENESVDPVQVQININSDALCFNPYKVDSSSADVRKNGADKMDISWDSGLTDVTVQALLVKADTELTAFISTAELTTLLSDPDFSPPASSQSSLEVTTFARPATTAWDMYLYVQSGDNWEIEGAFRYDEAWLIDMNHPAAP